MPETTICRLIVEAQKRAISLMHEKEIIWCILYDRVKYKTIQHGLRENIVD